jgi:hypothetical protein
MTIRTFWKIFLKILGMWLILEGLTIIPQLFTVFSFFGNNNNENIMAVILIVMLLLLTVGIYIFILRLFVFKTDWIIEKLKLDNGFQEEKLELNIPFRTALTIAIIVIGGLIFIDGLPQFCRLLFNFVQQNSLFRESSTSGWLIFYIVKTLIGYLLMTNTKTIIDFVNKQKEERITEHD